MEPGRTVWDSLLGACRIHGHVELAERACALLFELGPLNAGNYILLADICSETKMWEEVNTVKKILEAKGLQTVPGCSWIDLEKKIYSSVCVGEMNPQIEQLHALLVLLVLLVTEMKETVYVLNTKVVLYELDQKEKSALCWVTVRNWLWPLGL